mgnify:CR=1 FL=1
MITLFLIIFFVLLVSSIMVLNICGYKMDIVTCILLILVSAVISGFVMACVQFIVWLITIISSVA